METSAIHRVIERQCTARPDAIAVSDGARTLTYREFNGRANAMARRLIASGFSRGSLAMVRMAPSTDLAVVLLAILKAGGAYSWSDPGAAHHEELPEGLSIVKGENGREERLLALDLRGLLQDPWPPVSPNLPILTRPTEVACVLRQADGSPHVLVPHATIASLHRHVTPASAQWTGETGAFDLWLGLMSGAAVSIVRRAAVATAAA